MQELDKKQVNLVKESTGKNNKTASRIRKKWKVRPIESLQEDEWIINGKVYNLSTFIKYHPGGQLILNINRRRDCTELFETYHFMSDKQDYINKTLKKYYVRDVKPNEENLFFDWNDDLYHKMKKDLRNDIKNYFKTNNIGSYKANNLQLAIYFVLATMTLINFYFYCNGYWISMVLMGIFGFYICGDFSHCGTHYSIFKSAKWNIFAAKLFGWYHSVMSFWIYQHVISHHSYTNIEFQDIDLDWHRIHYLEVEKMRNVFIPNWFINYVISMFISSLIPILVSVPWICPSRRMLDIDRQCLKHCRISTIMHQCIGLLILPIILVFNLGFVKGLIFYVIPRMIHGVIFHFFSQISHVNHDSIQKENVEPNKNFILHQIMSGSDYATDSKLWNVLSVGLSNQVLHHLIPNIHPCHFPKLSNVLKEFCRKWQIKQSIHENGVDAFKAHFSHVENVNLSAKLSEKIK